ALAPHPAQRRPHRLPATLARLARAVAAAARRGRGGRTRPRAHAQGRREPRRDDLGPVRRGCAPDAPRPRSTEQRDPRIPGCRGRSPDLRRCGAGVARPSARAGGVAAADALSCAARTRIPMFTNLPPVTKVLLIINGLVFLLEILL